VKHGSLTDTDAAAERVWIEMLRSAPAWRKLQLASELYQDMRRLALSGLRARHPAAAEKELRRRLADLLLGPELAEKAYGPLPGAAE
jgi:beta-phosphoglucomutase-like phosphatase (HAD superfamily)